MKISRIGRTISFESNGVITSGTGLSLTFYGETFRGQFENGMAIPAFTKASITHIAGVVFDPEDEDNTMAVTHAAILACIPPNADNSSYLYTSSVFMAVETAALGTEYTAFGAQACDGLVIDNHSGESIEVKKGATSTVIPTGVSRYIGGIANANEISLRRADTTNTQVTVRAEAITV